MRISTGSHFELIASLATLITAISLLGTQLVACADPSAKQHPPPAKKGSKPIRKQLTGAELYAIHCNRCHPERYAPERTEAQWQTILLHMRTRANLPARQAKAILKFLQEDSGK